MLVQTILSQNIKYFHLNGSCRYSFQLGFGPSAVDVWSTVRWKETSTKGLTCTYIAQTYALQRTQQICIFPFLCVVLFFTLIIMVRAVLHVGEKHDFGVNPLRLVSYLVEPITPLGALFTEMKDTKMKILSGNKHNSFSSAFTCNKNTHLLWGLRTGIS